MGQFLKDYWLPFAVGVAIVVFLAFRPRGKATARRLDGSGWRCIHEGEFATAGHSPPDGEWIDAPGTPEATIVRFKDGQTVSLSGRVEVPFAAGTRIRVLTDDEGCYSFERVGDD